MSKYTDAIKNLCEIENQYEIFNEKIGILPIWSSVYIKIRSKYIYKHTGIPALSNHGKLNLKKCIYSMCISALHLFKLIFSKCTLSNVIYGFPRLEQIDGIYIDKFCDELIKHTMLANSYIYMERARSFNHLKPRYIDNIVWVDFLDNISIIIGKIVSPFIYMFNYKLFTSLYFKASKIIPLSKAEKRYIISKVSTDIIVYHITKLIFKKLKIERIFVPDLHLRPHLIAVAKKLDIPCFELQHGMTEGPTGTYSGQYIEDFSPTAFLAFGKSSMQPVFNVPMQKMYNIGFAFKKTLYSRIAMFNKNHYLLVSDPHITQQIIDIACKLQELYPNLSFAVRFHPLEKPSKQQLSQLIIAKVTITNNKENSSIAVLKYEGIIGERSTVLYEALCLDKKVAKLHFNNLNIGICEDNETSKGFTVLNNIEEFWTFHEMKFNKSKIEFYSDFNEEEFNKIYHMKHFRHPNNILS